MQTIKNYNFDGADYFLRWNNGLPFTDFSFINIAVYTQYRNLCVWRHAGKDTVFSAETDGRRHGDAICFRADCPLDYSRICKGVFLFDNWDKCADKSDFNWYDLLFPTVCAAPLKNGEYWFDYDSNGWRSYLERVRLWEKWFKHSFKRLPLC